MNGINYHERIPEILDERFINYDEIAHAMASAFAAKKNILLHGPGGHAKSEMIEAILRGLGCWDDTYVESFGEGLTEDNLWGGINLDALNRSAGAAIEFYPERSFLAYRYALFEEMLDAPSPVLLGLKDTLTRKELRKGAQRYPMNTEVIIAATNHDPEMYADSDDPADKARVALLERFPIRVEVKWEAYGAQHYLAMFKKHSLYGTVYGAAEQLAEILAEATREGHFVSPRTAVHALEIVYHNSLSRGHTSIQATDLADIRCLASLDKFGDNILEDIQTLAQTAEARTKLEEVATKLQELQVEAAGLGDSAMKIMACAKRAEEIKHKIYDVQVTDELTGERDEIANQADTLRNELEARGWDLIKTNA